LTDAQRREFESRGFLCPLRAFPDPEVEVFRARYTQYVARNQERIDALTPNLRYLVMSETHFVLPWV
jgi:hypothetical protein